MVRNFDELKRELSHIDGMATKLTATRRGNAERFAVSEEISNATSVLYSLVEAELLKDMKEAQAKRQAKAEQQYADQQGAKVGVVVASLTKLGG